VSVAVRARDAAAAGAVRSTLAPATPKANVLTFIGLGLYDERSVTVEGADALAAADRAFAEFYTSRLAGAAVSDLEARHGIDIEVRDRPGIEEDPEEVLAAAEAGDVAFLTAGDTMVATTHVDLRLRAHERGIDTRLVHGVSASSAVAGLSGLQNYRFGKAVTLPFPWAHGGGTVPASVVGSIEANRERGLHTLVYLDIKVDRAQRRRVEAPDDETFMTADRAAGLLGDAWDPDAVGVAVARAGSPDPVVAADRLSALAGRSFGDPLHALVIPGEVHHVEREALRALAGAPGDVV
jgi:diphthine synthase